MKRIVLAVCLTGLAGCTGTAAISTTAVGTLNYDGQTYPVEALGPDQAIWRVRAEGGPVACLKPTLTDCYWSLRNYLVTQAVPDVLKP